MIRLIRANRFGMVLFALSGVLAVLLAGAWLIRARTEQTYEYQWRLGFDLMYVGDLLWACSEEQNGGRLISMDERAARSCLALLRDVTPDGRRRVEEVLDAGLRFHTEKSLEGTPLKELGPEVVVLHIDWPVNTSIKGLKGNGSIYFQRPK